MLRLLADGISNGDVVTKLFISPKTVKSHVRQILAELEADTVDVDVLAARVARAQEIITTCRARIEGARMDVERLLAPE